MRSICDELCNLIKTDDIEEEKIHPQSCFYSIDSVMKYLKANKVDELSEMYHKQIIEINIDDIYIPPTFEYCRNYNSSRNDFENQIVNNSVSKINIDSYKEVKNQVKIDSVLDILNGNNSIEEEEKKEDVNYSPISSGDEEKKIEKENKEEIKIIKEEIEDEKVFSSDDDEEKENQKESIDNNGIMYENDRRNNENYCENNSNFMEIENDYESVDERNGFYTKNRIDVIADVLCNEIRNTYIPYTYYRPIGFEYSIGYIYNLLINKKLKPYNQIYMHNRKIDFGISKQDYSLVERSAIKRMTEGIFCLKCGSYVELGKEFQHLENDIIRNSCLKDIKYRNTNCSISDFERQIAHKSVISVGGCLSKDNSIIEKSISVDSLKNIDPVCEICNNKFDSTWDSEVVDTVYTKMIIIESDRLMFYHTDCYEIVNITKCKRKSIDRNGNSNDLFSLFEDEYNHEINHFDKKTKL